MFKDHCFFPKAMSYEFILYITFKYEKKVKIVMIINSTNINKTNNHLSPEVIEQKKNSEIFHWQSRTWLWICTKVWRVKPVNGMPTLPLSTAIQSSQNNLRDLVSILNFQNHTYVYF